MINHARLGAYRAPVLTAVASCFLAVVAAPARADHVPADKLLPGNTLLFAHVASAPQLVEAFKQTNFGRMALDPDIEPIIEHLYDAANEELAQFREQSGLSLDEILRIPQGEITGALIPTEAADPVPASVAGIVLVDCGDSIGSGTKLIDALGKLLESDAAPAQEQSLGEVKIRIFQNPTRRQRQIGMFVNDNTLVIVTGLQVTKVAQQLLDHWTTGQDDCVANNSQYIAIMDHSRGTKSEPPQATFYCDPVSLVWSLNRRNPAAQTVLTMLQGFGLDGFKGVGGSLVLTSEDFDTIMQFHLLLDSQRTGVLSLIALGAGDDTPPNWVPSDVTSYLSLHWNFEHTFNEGVKLADSIPFLGGQSSAQMVNDNVQSMLGVDLQNDLLPAATGRVIHLSWFNPELKLSRTAATCLAAELKDPKAFRETFSKIVDHLGSKFESKTLAGVQYYKKPGDQPDDNPRPQPCFAQLNNWILVCDRPAFLEHLVSRRDETADKLADALDYKLIVNKIGRQPGGNKAGMQSFSRDEDSWKHLYDLATSDESRQTLRQRGDRVKLFKILATALDKSTIPPWEEFAKYISPTGSMVVDDESGVHYMSFSLKRQAAQ